MLEFLSIDKLEADVYNNSPLRGIGGVIYKENKVIYLNKEVECMSFPSPECIYKEVFEEGTWLKKDGKFLIILDVASYYA